MYPLGAGQIASALSIPYSTLVKADNSWALSNHLAECQQDFLSAQILGMSISCQSRYWLRRSAINPSKFWPCLWKLGYCDASWQIFRKEELSLLVNLFCFSQTWGQHFESSVRSPFGLAQISHYWVCPLASTFSNMHKADVRAASCRFQQDWIYKEDMLVCKSTSQLVHRNWI